jgi:hypothetical protein
MIVANVALSPTPVELRMHTRLFGIPNREIASVADAAMWRLLRGLRRHPDFDPFRIWLVGSRVQPGRNGSDIDIVLSVRDGWSPGELAIERALWRARDYGLHAATPVCLVDPCFRAFGPTITTIALRSNAVLTSIKLFSPKLMKEVFAGRVRNHRRLGHFSVEYSKHAGETSYYAKLPIRNFGGILSPYLRPAIEVHAAN